MKNGIKANQYKPTYAQVLCNKLPRAAQTCNCPNKTLGIHKVKWCENMIDDSTGYITPKKSISQNNNIGTRANKCTLSNYEPKNRYIKNSNRYNQHENIYHCPNRNIGIHSILNCYCINQIKSDNHWNTPKKVQAYYLHQ